MYWNVPSREDKKIIEAAGLESTGVAVHRCDGYLTVLHHKSHTTTTIAIPPRQVKPPLIKCNSLGCLNLNDAVDQDALDACCGRCFVQRFAAAES